MLTAKNHPEPIDDLDAFIADESHDPDFRHAYEDAQTRSALLRHLVAARHAQGLSQKDVSKYMATTQSAVSELEGGRTDPQFSTLQRYARAVNVRLTVRVSAVPGVEGLSVVEAWGPITASSSAWRALMSRSRPSAAVRDVVYEKCTA